MKARWPIVATLILALVAVASVVPRANASMNIRMAVAAAAGVDMPCCEGCATGSGGDAATPCDQPCTASLLALAGLADGLPTQALPAGWLPAGGAGLVGTVWPPDTGPPRGLHVA